MALGLGRQSRKDRGHYVKKTTIAACAALLLGCVATVIVTAKDQDNHPPVAVVVDRPSGPRNDDLKVGGVDTLQVLRIRLSNLETGMAEVKRAMLQNHLTTPALFEFGEFVANLNEPQMNRYLRVSLVFELDPAGAESDYWSIHETRIQLTDWLISQMSSLTVADTVGRDNLDRFRNDLVTGFNTKLKAAGHSACIKSVLLREFNVQ